MLLYHLVGFQCEFGEKNEYYNAKRKKAGGVTCLSFGVRSMIGRVCVFALYKIEFTNFHVMSSLAIVFVSSEVIQTIQGGKSPIWHKSKESNSI